MDYTDEQLCQENGNTPATKGKRKIRFKVTKPDLNRLRNGIRNLGKRILTKKGLVTITLAVTVLIGASVGISYATNNYMTPVRYAESQENWKNLNVKKYMRKSFDILGTKSGREIVKLLCESDVYLDMMESMEDAVEEGFEKRQDLYGDNFKVKYTVEDKIALEKADLRQYRDALRRVMGSLQSILDETEGFDSYDWADFAEELGLSRTQAKKLVAVYSQMLEDIGRVEPTKGYELDVVRTFTGNMLDEPVEDNITVIVLKINGRWVGISDVYKMNNLLVGNGDDMFYLKNPTVPKSPAPSKSPAATMAPAPALAEEAPAPAP